MSSTEIALAPVSKREIKEDRETMIARQEEKVVEQFVAASQEIVPTVQVSLAKRIVRPGSNRVVCLAAHTSVPLNEDELASVSDLALRLSDGTNVRLSVSFFNDNDREVVYHPDLNRADTFRFNRSASASSYDPDRYSAHSSGESKLGPVLCMLVAIPFAAYCAFSNCHDWSSMFSPHTQTPSKVALMDHKQLAPSTSVTTAKQPATENARGSHESATDQSSHQATKSSANSSRSESTERPVKSHSRHASKPAPAENYDYSAPPTNGKSMKTHAAHNPAANTMLVPPPPPMSLPLGTDTSQFAPAFNLIANPGAFMQTPAVQAPKAPATSSTPASRPHMTKRDTAPDNSTYDSNRNDQPSTETSVPATTLPSTHTRQIFTGPSTSADSVIRPVTRKLQFDSSVVLPGFEYARTSPDNITSRPITKTQQAPLDQQRNDVTDTAPGSSDRYTHPSIQEWNSTTSAPAPGRPFKPSESVLPINNHSLFSEFHRLRHKSSA